MNAIGLYLTAPIDPLDSYGLVTLQLAEHLAMQGRPVHLADQPIENGLPTTAKRLSDGWPVVTKTLSEPAAMPPGGILIGWPDNFARLPMAPGPKVALTMFETTKLPPTWAGILNQFDAVIVPSWSNQAVFVANGVTVPILVVPLGIGDIYQFYARPQRSPLTFLTFVDRGIRKNGLAAVKAFQMAFGDDPRVRMVIKSRASRLRIIAENRNIEVIQQDMTQQELYDLYCATDCLVNPTRGEGFGLLPREVAATGGISLTTAWGGTADGLDRWGYPLPYTLVPARWHDMPVLRGLDLGCWAEPDVEAMASRMRQVADHLDVYRSLARRKAEAARQLYSWSDFATTVYNIWEGVCDGYRSTTKLAA